MITFNFRVVAQPWHRPRTMGTRVQQQSFVVETRYKVVATVLRYPLKLTGGHTKFEKEKFIASC